MERSNIIEADGKAGLRNGISLYSVLILKILKYSWDGWQGTLYEKAKEDFLGGNTVRTNGPTAEYIRDGSGNIIYYQINEEGEFVLDNHGNRIIGTKDNGVPILTDSSAYIDAWAYMATPGGEIIPIDKSKVESDRVYLETPRVNVNELVFSNNEMEWTVYLGETVNPIDELKIIPVPLDNEYIVDDGDYFKRVNEIVDYAVDLECLDGTYYWKLDNKVYIVIEGAAYLEADEETDGAVQLEEDSTMWYLPVEVDKISGDFAYKRVLETVDGIIGVTTRHEIWYWELDPDKYTTDSEGRRETAELETDSRSFVRHNEWIRRHR